MDKLVQGSEFEAATLHLPFPAVLPVVVAPGPSVVKYTTAANAMCKDSRLSIKDSRLSIKDSRL